MRLNISDQFTVRVVTPKGGVSKGRPIALVEEPDRWRVADLLIPNGLSDQELEHYVAGKFSDFARPGLPIRRFDQDH